MTAISATDASRKFSDLLDKVTFEQEQFEILRGGKPVARIVPMASAKPGSLRAFLVRLEARRAIQDPRFADDMEQATAALSDVSSLDDPWER